MNNIFGQPDNYYGNRENSYTRPCSQTQPLQYNNEHHCEQHHEHHEHHEHHCECNQKCGTVFRINIPAGAEINVLNIVELAAPTGICLILRLPFLAGECREC